VFTSIQLTANGSRSDSVGVFLYDADANRSIWQGYWNGPSPAELDTMPFLTSAMVLPVRLDDLVSVIGDSDFSCRLELYATEASTSELVDTSGPHRFHARRPALGFGEASTPAPYWPDAPGQVVAMTPDRDTVLASGVSDVLLIHHHNSEPERAELVPISLVDPSHREPRGATGRP
jgi:hypothetical protein